MIEFFADLHVHIGRTTDGKPVKISASPQLTFPRILEEAANRKGIEMVGVVDCISPGVLEDVAALLDDGRMEPVAGGGLRYGKCLTVILAAEIGADVQGKEAHFLAYVPTYEAARDLSTSLTPYVTNLQLSSQKARLSCDALFDLTEGVGGILVPAHVFTPHKGVYGQCVDTLTNAFEEQHIQNLAAIELGLGADTALALRIQELDTIPFVSNSDAHSLKRIGREYNRIQATTCSFNGLRQALTGEEGRIVANYGIDPRLGKYRRTWCHTCDQPIPLLPNRRCPMCSGTNLTVGVIDRVAELADRSPEEVSELIQHRPPYVYQIPLEFVPGVGPRTMDKLLNHFGTEMNILHRTSEEELAAVVGPSVAQNIVAAREGRLQLTEGGGGVYGRLDSINA